MSRTLFHNLDWLSANANRNYPLDDAATKRDDQGLELPDGLLADLQLWTPQDNGQAAFISSVTIGPQLVSLTLAAAADRPYQDVTPPSFQPLAVLTVAKPVNVGQNYPLAAVVPGTGGWLAFGPVVNSLAAGSWRFSDPTATGLLPRNVRAYPVNGVTSLSKLGAATALHGAIKVISNDPDRLVIEYRKELIEGVERDAVVFRLNEAVSGRGILQEFLGPCGGLPDSNTCRSPQIERINGASPTCDGIIWVHFRELWPAGGGPDLVISYADTTDGGLEPGHPDRGHTVNLDYNRGLSAVCSKPAITLPDLPDNACDDACDKRVFTDPGPLGNYCFSFVSPVRFEPGNEVPNTGFLVLSDPCTLDLKHRDSVRIEGASQGILLLIPYNPAVVQSPDPLSYSPGTEVAFTVPVPSLVFRETSGFLVNKEIITDSGHVLGTCSKVVIDDAGHAVSWPAGAPATDGTGTVDDMMVAGFPVDDLNREYTKVELRALGFVDDQDRFRFRVAHIVSGYGSAQLRVKCPRPNKYYEDCEDSGSSSSSSSSS